MVKIGTFEAGTGILGGTKQGQKVTKKNAHELPPGSVIRLDDVGRLIHLHEGLWLYCTDNSHHYDRLDNLLYHLPGTLCHIPIPNEVY
jgi:hypothetical protein